MDRILAFFFLLYTSIFFAQNKEYRLTKDIHYYRTSDESKNEYMQKMCVLDIYYPKFEAKEKLPVIVWFHGGGLIGGEKFIPQELKEKGFVVVAPNYRLSPKVKNPTYLEDAAAAVAWVFKNIDSYNGNKNKIFVSGHSAGGYLTSMIGLDKKWLEKFEINANDIAGLIPFSGHSITHFTIRKEQDIPKTVAVIDEFAPLFHVRKDASPILLITGDRDMEMLGRYEENAYFLRMLKTIGHTKSTLYELEGYTHGAMAKPAFPLLINFVNNKNNEYY